MSAVAATSLRGRVVLAVLALLTILLVALFVIVDLALGARLRADLRTRLTDRVALAEQLDGALSPQQLVDRLTGDGVQVQLCSPTTSTTSVRCVSPHVAPTPPDAAKPGPAGKPATPAHRVQPTTVERDGGTLFVRTNLPHSGQLLSLSVDGSDVGATLHRLILLEILGGAVALLAAAVLLGRIVGVALRPLDRMTALATSIAHGDRGRRLAMRRADTELGRTAAAFDAMLDELESSNERLRTFVADASHELRSPLASVQAGAELLLRDEGDVARRQQRYVALIRETRRAGRLVDDLLTIGRLDSGPLPLHLAPVDLAEVVAHEASRVRMSDGRLTVLVDAEPSVVHGDHDRLVQILANLLDNARHATPAGGTIRVSVRNDGSWCRVEVTDTGNGVPAADRERIFDRLVRLDTARARSSGGFGLGLPIARSLARAHGGELTCEPAESGAAFQLVLPLATAAMPAPTARPGRSLVG